MPVQYFYFNNRLPTGAGKFNTRPENLSLVKVTKLTDTTNPVFNFTPNFVANLQQIAPTELAQAMPYAGLYSLSPNGELLTDFNTTFFSKPIDMNAISTSGRYGDRPQMSLQRVEISTNLARGAGFMSLTDVKITMILHKPDLLTNSKLIATLLPGMPMKLVYGWSDANDSFLNRRDIMFFNVREYTMSFDASGQATLVLDGTSHNENFSNIFVGDRAEKIEQMDIDNAKKRFREHVANDVEVDGLYRQQVRVGNYTSYINALDVIPNSEGRRNVSINDYIGLVYTRVSERVSKTVQRNYKESIKRLSRQRKSLSAFRDVKKKNNRQNEFVTLHDIVSILCGDTLDKLQGTVVPANKNYRVVYGCFNENAGSYAGRNIGLFPVHWATFSKALDESRSAGFIVPSLQFIFNILGSNFLNNSAYWQHLLAGQSNKTVETPNVSFYVSSHASGLDEIEQISVLDTVTDVPLTQKALREGGILSEDDQRKRVLGKYVDVIPVIKLGHANSFIKSISIDHVNDPYMRALLITRIVNGPVTTERQAITPAASADSDNKQALFLPLNGQMDVIGHVDWKPARFFYLSTGIFFLDGMYCITDVSHSLDVNGYKTSIKFIMH